MKQRHTRAKQRYQRDRWILKRIRQARRARYLHVRIGGYYAKKDPWDCGKTDCFCCHHRKLLNLPRRQIMRQEEPCKA